MGGGGSMRKKEKGAAARHCYFFGLGIRDPGRVFNPDRKSVV